MNEKYADLTIVGLHDADGSFENNLSPRVGKSYGLKQRISFSQKTSNSDVIAKVYEAIGEDPNVTYATRTVRKDSEGNEINESKGVFNITSPGGQKLLAIFEKNPPLAPGKFRDYLIFLKICSFKETREFEELNSISFSSKLKNFDRDKIGLISCIWLMYHNAQSFKYSAAEREMRAGEMNDKITQLNPLQEELALGLDLGKSCLGLIEEKQKNHEITLENNLKLHNDYMVGMFIGDGWFFIYIKIDPDKPKIKIVVALNIIQSTDCIQLLNAFQTTFDGKGAIVADSAKKAAYVYKLEGVKNCVQYVIPLFNQYKFSSTKQKQYDLFREVVLLLNEKKHLTPEGLDKVIELAYKFSALSQGSRTVTIEEQKNLAALYFKKRNNN